jgi:hypothetical protein
MATQAIELGRSPSDDTASREPGDRRLGIVGAGKLGTTIARAAIAAGYADPEIAGAPDGTSMVVHERFPSARVVKSLNQLGYHELEEHRRPRGTPNRIAMAAAGDDRVAVRAVMRLVDRLGFDPVDAGPLENGLVLEPDGSLLAVTYSAGELSNFITHRPGRGTH